MVSTSSTRTRGRQHILQDRDPELALVLKISLAGGIGLAMGAVIGAGVEFSPGLALALECEYRVKKLAMLLEVLLGQCY
jgi:hypothetical protein